MKNIALSLTLIAAIVSNPTIADSPAEPQAFVTTNPSCSCYFTMIPAQGIYDENTQARKAIPPFGQAFHLNEDGSTSLMWEVSGWYSFENYLSSDGRYLVRMGNWPQGKAVSKSHLALAFYDNGKELKQYSTADLLKNPKKIQRTVSHYFWKANDSNYPRIEYKNNFLLKTIDGYIHEFDMETGELIKSTKSK